MKLTIDAFYNVFNANSVPADAVNEAETLLFNLLLRKRTNFEIADEKTQKKLLRNENYLDHLDYTEQVLFGSQRTDARSQFRLIAKKYKLFIVKGDGSEVVNDIGIVNALAQKSQAWFHGKKSNHTMPLFAVIGSGRQTVFMRAESAANLAAGFSLTPDSIASLVKGVIPGREPKPVKERDEEIALHNQEDIKAQIAALQAENAALKQDTQTIH